MYIYYKYNINTSIIALAKIYFFLINICKYIYIYSIFIYIKLHSTMKPLFSIIPNSKLFVWLWIAWMILCAGLFLMYQRYSVQFTWWIEISTSIAIANPQNLSKDIQSLVSSEWNILSETSYHNTSVGGTDIIVQLNIQDDQKIADISKKIKSDLVSKKYISDDSKIVKFGIVWPSVGSYIKSTAIYAIVFGLLLMTVYMIFAFMGVRKQISPAILAAITIFTMIFDVLTPAGVYGLRMMIDPTVQVDVIFIIAVLTIMGYSINDTVIIFDRIRENLEKSWNNPDYSQIFEDSLRQTMKRSIGTSFSVLLVLIGMYIFWHWDLARFAFTMLVGVVWWSVSSIFLAAPLAYLIIDKKPKITKK